MPPRSAGILLYRDGSSALEVWIAHMGGPFWSRKDERAWSIPKGEYGPEEDPMAAALREFEEEIGVPAPDVPYQPLGDFRQPSGKIVTAFAGRTDFHVDRVLSNTVAIEWPTGSGKILHIPEIDDARWVGVDEARIKLVRGQVAVLDALQRLIT